MRHLLDTYIRAEETEKLTAFDDMTLVQLVVERGEGAVDALPEGLRKDHTAVAETIENNVRRLIIDEMAVNPKYYERMSELLDALIRQRKQEALEYKAYLAKIVDLTKQVCQPESQSSYPKSLNTSTLRALFDNLEEPTRITHEPRAPFEGRITLEQREAKALAIDETIRRVKKADWRGNTMREREVRNAIREVLENEAQVEKIYGIIKAQRDY
jgi:type I restriction enzyme R subunit